MTWRRACLALLLVVACGTRQAAQQGAAPVVLPEAKPEARPHFDEGLRLLGLGPAKYEAARDAFKKAVEVDPKLYEAWHDLGVIEARLGRWDAAREALERALSVQPGSGKTVLALGDVMVRAGDPLDAAKLYKQRLGPLPPGSGEELDLRLLRAQALREAGQGKEALDELQALLMKDSRNARVFNALGLVYYKQEKLSLAESALRRAAELDPKDPTVWNNLGLVTLARGRDVEAFAAFEKATDLDPKSVEARLNKAAVFLDCGDYKRAAEELERAAKVRPDDPEVQVALGVAMRGQKKFARAREAYERALVLHPDYPPALYNLAILHMDHADDKASEQERASGRVKAREHLILYRKVAPPNDPKRADALSRLKELK